LRRENKEIIVKAFSVEELDAFFRSLEADYDVRVPVSRHDGTRTLGVPGDGPLALAGGVVPSRITNVFFPHLEAVLAVRDGGTTMPSPLAKPLFVAGLTAQDADCLEFVDQFFAAGLPDDLYRRRRSGAVVACVSGRCGAGGEFLKIARGKCDLELVGDGRKYILAAYSDAGKALAGKLPGGEPVANDALAKLIEESDALPADDLHVLQTASKLLLENKVPDEFWQKIANRCIACTSCNLACPSCTCFDVFDRKAADGIVERWRLWDSCQLDGFQREASGHNPMGAQRQRTHRRIHHRLAADVIKWGHITCYLCGRCDMVCPTGIGIKAVCRELVQEYGAA